MITHDFHVHLHGVLSAGDLWHIGRDTYQHLEPRLQWFASEYAKAWGQSPDYASYWRAENGLELLAKDFEVTKPVTFQQFQACFNLIVALCPLQVDDFSLQEYVIRKVAAAGVHYFEARTLISRFFTAQQAQIYLKGLCQKVLDLNRELPLRTSLVIGLERDVSLRDLHYQWLRDFCASEPHCAEVISGIDFAGWEEDFSPEKNRAFLARCLADNATMHPLNLLYHVGESFSTLSMASALRWIHTVIDGGVRRLGHALALGCNPDSLAGTSVEESLEEYLLHQHWLTREAKNLEHFGYRSLMNKQDNAQVNELRKTVTITYTPEYIADIKNLQLALAALVREKQLIIESCVSSNACIGPQQSWEDHPLRFFYRQGLRVVLGSDDPGIFASNWHKEATLAQQITGDFAAFAKTALDLYTLSS